MTEMVCLQPGCPFAVSGRCIEGFDPPSSCPFQAAKDTQQDEAATYVTDGDLVDLPSGEALTELQASEVVREDSSKVVIIAGPYDSGKTTILTSLYEAFQEAPFSNFQFRGSRTLIGFERRCHLGRSESGADEANTTHTSLREGLVFLHLALAKIEREELQHSNLLLSDISGELFRRMRDSTKVAGEFLVLKRTDHLCIVIDGRKICLPEERHVARNDSRSILRSMMESGNLQPGCVIDVIFSKWDVVVDALSGSDSANIQEFLESTRAALASMAAGFDIRFHEVAARPSKGAKVPFAHGLPTLLRSWMARPRMQEAREVSYVASGLREFSRFTSAVIRLKHLEAYYDVRQV
jgi:hypothetical protein